MTKLDNSDFSEPYYCSYKILKKAISSYLRRIKRYMLLLEIGVWM